MYKLVLIGLVLVGLVLVGLVGAGVYVGWSMGEPCRNLKKLARDEEVIQALWPIILNWSETPELFEGRGVIHAKNVDGFFGISWADLNIPLSIATVGLTGTNMDYKNLDFRSVETIRIGYGYRKHLVIHLPGVPLSEIDPLQLKVEADCRIGEPD